MVTTRLLSGIAAVSLFLSALPAGAQESATASSSSAPAGPKVRVERCKRFTKPNDYDRCVRLIQRLPTRGGASSSASSQSSSAAPYDENDEEWKWENVAQRMEERITTSIKLAALEGKEFCKDRTSENTATSRECMSRLRDIMRKRIDRVIGDVYRGQLPSAR